MVGKVIGMYDSQKYLLFQKSTKHQLSMDLRSAFKPWVRALICVMLAGFSE
jgi:hypothetical protein